MTLIESADYDIEAHNHAQKKEVIAAALELKIRGVDFDFDSHSGMMGSREVLHRMGINPSYIGGAARSIKYAYQNLDEHLQDEITTADYRMLQGIAVHVFISNPSHPELDPNAINLTMILDNIEANVGVTNKLEAVKYVLDQYKLLCNEA